MENYLESLNSEQKKAVIATNGPVLIVAGAGAGKTKTITNRIMHLIKQGVPPESILAITFTNKAAHEMLERVNKLLSEDSSLNRPISQFNNSKNNNYKLPATGYPWIGTFHSLGVKILRENFKSVNIHASFSIFDRGDSMRSIKEAMKRLDFDPKSYEPGKILSIISREKSNMVTAGNFSERIEKNPIRRMVAMVWQEYEKILTEEKALDFDDLLLKTAVILKRDQTIREHYQNIWRYIHVDEYQDTNIVQYQITKLLAEKNRNLCVVGDVDQNIYSWRGADIKNILDFEKDYPEAKIVVLEENYRSTQTILTVANRIIEKNKLRRPKNLFTKNSDGEKIGIFVAYDETEEANFVATKTAEIIGAGVSPDEIAVLYRANFQSRALEEAFLNNKLPYQVIGTKFFERKEIKDAIAYIKVAREPDNFPNWKRIANVPPRGIGKVTLAKIASGQKDFLPPAVKKSIKDLEILLSSIAEKIKAEKLSVAVRYAIEYSGMIESLKNDGSEGEERIENLKELITFASHYDTKPGEEAVEQFLTDVALSTDQDEMEKKKSAVRLMTVHASKGLEFKVVFITGLEEDLFPHKRLSEERVTDNEAEEERRLFYVALTRAKKKVYLTYADVRMIFGNRQVNVPSEFILDIDEEFLFHEEAFKGGGGKTIYLD